MEFEIKHNGKRKKIKIENEIDLDKLFQYKNDEVYYLLDKMKIEVEIQENEISDTHNNFTYQRHQNNEVEVTLYGERSTIVIYYYKDRLLKRSVFYEFGKIQKETNYINGKKISIKLYYPDEKIKEIQYYDMELMTMATINRDYLSIRSKIARELFSNSIEGTIKKIKIYPYNIQEMDWAGKVVALIKKDQEMIKNAI